MQEKLDDIVSLLASAQQPASQLLYVGSRENPPVLQPHQLRESITRHTDHGELESVSVYDAGRSSEGPSVHSQPSDLAAATTLRVPPPKLHTSVDSTFDPDLEPSAAEAAELLSRFRALFVLHFPFVVIPAAKSAQELQREKPYLYRSIMMVAAYDQPVRQGAMGKQILLGFSTSLLLRAEKSLDLLQALLVYTAWFVHFSQILSRDINVQHVSCLVSLYDSALTVSTSARHYYHFSVNPGLTNILQLTLGLMFDLGLKAPRSYEEEEPFTYAMPNADDYMAKKEINIAEEQRAFLGCFFLASV